MKHLLLRTAIGIALCCLALVAPARAHDPTQAWATAVVKPTGIEITMVLSPYPALSLLDKSLQDRAMSPENFELLKPEFQRAALDLFDITDAGRPLKARAATVEMTEEADIEFKISYPPPTTGPLRFLITYFDRVVEGFITTLFIEDKAGQSLAWDEMSMEKTWLEAPLSAAPNPSNPLPPTSTAASVPPVPKKSAGEFIVLGAKSMILGFDHLLFVAGLLIACRRLGPTVAAVGCFVLGHSLTLTLGTFTTHGLPSRWVAPLIAVSLVVIGLENLIRRHEPRGRWITAYVFGLIHGFGFANVFKESVIASGKWAMLPSLLSFNLGIELALLAATALLLAVFWKLRGSSVFARFMPAVISMAVTGFGISWLLQRTVLS